MSSVSKPTLCMYEVAMTVPSRETHHLFLISSDKMRKKKALSPAGLRRHLFHPKSLRCSLVDVMVERGLRTMAVADEVPPGRQRRAG